MKRIALPTLFVIFFFGAFASVSAGPTVPPQQYYIRWHSVPYTCSHSPGNYQLDVLPSTYNYYVPQGTRMIAVDKVDSASEHSSGAEPAVTNWPNGAGQKEHRPDVADSKSYPITAHIALETFINNILVYESTYTATCTANSHGTLYASITNNNHPSPMQFAALSLGNLEAYHP